MKKSIFAFLIITFLNQNFLAQSQSVWNKIPFDIKSRKYFKRFEWDYKQRAFPNETIPEKKYAKIRRMEIKQIKTQNLFKSSLPSWTSIGPSGIQSKSNYAHWGVVSGRVRAIAVHPTDHLTTYIGAACGGLWKTTDGGNSWIDIGHDLESLTFGAIAIDSLNPNKIFAGSGETGYFTS